MYRLLFLIGMPGAGKTHWGQRIAGAYNLLFEDLDAYITTNEKAEIAFLFGNDGEEVFREKESKYLAALVDSAKADTIIACGGGTPCFNNNLALMKQAGIVIYLQADIATLAENIKKSDELRPLLRGKPDIPAYLDQLLEQRKHFYEQAHYILRSDNISITTFAEIISSCTDKP